MDRVYLDWNATTPPLPEALDAMARAAREAWANPSSVHAHGRAARACVEDAREAVAALCGVDPRDVLLTSGGTEANNLALRSAFVEPGGVLVTSRLEHPSVVKVAEALAREGRARVRWTKVTTGGALDRGDLEAALEDRDVRLLALGAVNAETGVVEDVRVSAARVHVDVVQAPGRIAIPEGDTRSLAAHKFRGPKGIGALVLRPGVAIAPVLLGGSQERGLRPGTVDPIAAAGLAVAARHARVSPAIYASQVAPLRDRLEAALVALGGRVNGDVTRRAPHVTNVAFDGWTGPELVAALDLEGVSVSSGSACSAGTNEPSPVLAAMFGAGDARAISSVRASLGETTTDADVDRAIAAFRTVLERTTAAATNRR